VGRASSRGDRPTELGYSWLPGNWIEVQPPGFSFHPYQTDTPKETERVSQRRYSSFETRYNFTRRIKIIIDKRQGDSGGPKSSHPNRKR